MHVGQLIEKVAKERRVSNKELADHLNKVPSAIPHIFKRESVDTGLLRRLGEVLKYNFFEALSDPSTAEKVEEKLTEPSIVSETEPEYKPKNKGLSIPIMVELDGTAQTLKTWINRLTVINQAV